MNQHVDDRVDGEIHLGWLIETISKFGGVDLEISRHGYLSLLRKGCVISLTIRNLILDPITRDMIR